MNIRETRTTGITRGKRTGKTSPPRGDSSAGVSADAQTEKITLSGAAPISTGARKRKSHSGLEPRSWKEEMDFLFKHFYTLQDDKMAGRTAKLVLATVGTLPYPDSPRDSLVDRSHRFLKQSEELLSAMKVAADHHVTANTVEAVDVAQQMFDAIPSNWDRPMDKAYAGIRMELALAGMLGSVRPVGGGEEFFLSPLANLRDDGQPPALAQVTIQQVRKDFDKLRELALEFDEQGIVSASDPAKKIVVKESTVEIGGVRLAIRRE